MKPTDQPTNPPLLPGNLKRSTFGRVPEQKKLSYLVHYEARPEETGDEDEEGAGPHPDALTSPVPTPDETWLVSAIIL